MSTALPSSAPPAPSAPRCAACCATAPIRPPRSSRSPPSARRASELDDGLVVQGLADDERLDGFDVAIFSAGGSISREWAPRFAAARRDRGRQLVAPSAWTPTSRSSSPRSTRTRSTTSTRASSPTRTARRWRSCCRCTRCTIEFGLTGDRRDELPGRRRRRAEGHGRARSPRSRACSPTPTPRQTTARAPPPRSARRPSSASRWPSTSCRCWARDTGNGYTDEEMKLQNESRKILGIPELAVSPTCVRVPVMVGHAIEVRATFEREPSVAAALEVMGAHAGVELDDVPTPLEWAGKDPVAVGRVRQDLERPLCLEPLRRRRQPAQGRRAEHGADRRAAARARPARHPRGGLAARRGAARCAVALSPRRRSEARSGVCLAAKE